MHSERLLYRCFDDQRRDQEHLKLGLPTAGMPVQTRGAAIVQIATGAFLLGKMWVKMLMTPRRVLIYAPITYFQIFTRDLTKASAFASGISAHAMQVRCAAIPIVFFWVAEGLRVDFSPTPWHDDGGGRVDLGIVSRADGTG